MSAAAGRFAGPRGLSGIVLITLGVLGLVYGSVTWISGYHHVDLGVMDLFMKKHETLHIPVWAGVSAVAVGALLLFSRRPTQGR